MAKLDSSLRNESRHTHSIPFGYTVGIVPPPKKKRKKNHIESILNTESSTQDLASMNILETDERIGFFFFLLVKVAHAVGI